MIMRVDLNVGNSYSYLHAIVRGYGSAIFPTLELLCMQFV